MRLLTRGARCGWGADVDDRPVIARPSSGCADAVAKRAQPLHPLCPATAPQCPRETTGRRRHNKSRKSVSDRIETKPSRRASYGLAGGTANTHLGHPARKAVGCPTRRLGLDAIRQGLSRFVVATPAGGFARGRGGLSRGIGVERVSPLCAGADMRFSAQPEEGRAITGRSLASPPSRTWLRVSKAAGCGTLIPSGMKPKPEGANMRALSLALLTCCGVRLASTGSASRYESRRGGASTG